MDTLPIPVAWWGGGNLSFTWCGFYHMCYKKLADPILCIIGPETSSNSLSWKLTRNLHFEPYRIGSFPGSGL